MNNLTQANGGKSINFTVLGYSDFNSLQATVTRGQSYPLSIKPGISWSGRLPILYCRVWIDYNGNKTFEDNEKVFEGLAQNPYSSNIVIPATATLGNTRMRVSLKSGAYPTPCESYLQGEVEDYTVIIK
jgi:trimeric autotransporter adhesin